MLITSLTLGVSAAELTGRAVVGLLDGRTVVKVPPPAMRQLLLTFQSSVRGRIPQILGASDEARIETLVTLLQGSSEEDLTIVLDAAQEALNRLEESRSRRPSSPRRESRRAGRGRARR